MSRRPFSVIYSQPSYWWWVIVCLVYSSASMAISPYQYRAKVRKAALAVHAHHPYTFFCEYPFDPATKVIDMPLTSILPDRSRKVVWMPIVPLPRIGESLACWHGRCDIQGKIRQGSICCTANHARYRAAEGDLHNLVPVSAQWDRWRAHRDFKVVQEGKYVDCHAQEGVDGIFPPPKNRGVVARAYLYMQATYQVGLSSQEIRLYRTWDADYPPEPWEQEWNKRITDYQGNDNVYISRRES